jgi:hypothetical protein
VPRSATAAPLTEQFGDGNPVFTLGHHQTRRRSSDNPCQTLVATVSGEHKGFARGVNSV